MERAKKRRIYFIYTVVISTVFIIGATAGQARTKPALAKSDVLRQLVQVENRVASGTPSVTMKYGTTYRRYSRVKDILKIGQHLSEKFHLPVSSQLSDVEGHPSYQVNTVQSEGKTIMLTLTAMGKPGSRTYLIFDLRSKNKSLPSLLKWRREWNEMLQQNGFKATWNIMVQNTVVPENPKERPDTLIQPMVRALKAQQIGHYTGNGTLSNSYYSPLISGSVLSGQHKMNLQIAAHRITGSNLWRITAGTPVITDSY